MYLQYSSICDKKPFGAVCEGERVNLILKIESSMPFTAKLRLMQDRKEEEEYFPLEPSSERGRYSCTFSVPQSGLYFYDFLLEDENGNRKRFGRYRHDSTEEESSPPFQLTVYSKHFHTPAWCKGAIMYQIFPDRFAKSEHFSTLHTVNETQRIIHEDWEEEPDSFLNDKNYSAKDFYMGNLKGIEEKKSYFKDLNVDVLYLNPVFEASDNHRYCTGDFRKIDGFLGSNEDFRQLTNSLHSDGIRIILDGVFSHAGWDSKYFNRFGHYDSKGAYQSESSPYRSWFLFEEYPDKYLSWWGFENLPNFDKSNPEYLNYITDEKNGVISYWQNYGISGWRLDVADELPDPFLDSIRRSVKRGHSDNLIIGEVWEDASNKESYNKRRRYLLGEQLDSVMNYPWRRAIIDFMKRKDAESFSYEITSILENYPKPSIDALMNILSTHDTNRIINELGILNPNLEELPKNYRLSEEEKNRGRDLLLYASFLQFTLPGIPSIYYGDEAGLEGMTDPFNRRTYPYGHEDRTLLEHYRSLCEFRKNNREHFSSDMEVIFQEKSCIAYRRGELLCIVNVGDDAVFIPYRGLKKEVFSNNTPSICTWGAIVPPTSFQSIVIENREP